MRNLFPLLLLAACSSTTTIGGDTAGGNDTAGGDTGVPSPDFCGAKQIFNDHCTVCHSASGHKGDLDLETDPYSALVGVQSAAYGQTLVVAGDPSSSLLYLKMTGQQGANGEVMPTTGALPAALTDVVKTWITDGASSECNAVDTGSGKYHPSGWDDPSQHGMAAKFQSDDCKSCHGDSLQGGSSSVTCDDCHDAGWQDDCTFCHGGTDGDKLGSPGEDLDDSTTSLTFEPHRAHTDDTSLHDAFACSQCHVTHDTALSASHFLDTADTAPGTAEMTFSKGLSDKATYAGGTCSNLYCHGDGTGDNGTIKSSGSVSGCNDCHKSSGLNGKHDDHLEEGVGCEECHSTTASSSTKIKDPTMHVNGSVEVALPAGMSYDGSHCDGSCHNRKHDNEKW